MQTVKLSVHGANCKQCVLRLVAALRGVKGVAEARVDLAAGEATIEAADETDVAALESAVRAAGYDCQPAKTT